MNFSSQVIEDSNLSLALSEFASNHETAMEPRAATNIFNSACSNMEALSVSNDERDATFLDLIMYYNSAVTQGAMEVRIYTGLESMYIHEQYEANTILIRY